MRLLTVAAASVTLLLSDASFAADRYQVRAPSFGCVVTWTTWAVNDQHNPRRHDYRWLRHVIDRGQCRMIGPSQQWEQIVRTNGLLLLRPVPSAPGITSLFFRPTDLQRGRIAVDAPVPVPVAPPVSSQDLSPPNPQPAPANDPVAAAPAPAPVTTAPPAQEALPPGPDPVPDSAPPVAAPDPTSKSSANDPATPASPGSEPQAAASSATPAPTGTAPSDVPAIQPPPVATPPIVAAAPVVASANPASTRTALAIGLVAALVVLAGLIVLGLRRRSRRRVGLRRQERSLTERLDSQAPAVPDSSADLVSPPIDAQDYRQRCVKSLGEAGWQARMSFPAGGLTADIIAKRDGRLLTMQCRPSTRPLESVVVQEALIVRRAQDANLAAVVSNAGYTKAARSFAAASGVRLLHETELPEFIG
jgi:hypothetical protein